MFRETSDQGALTMEVMENQAPVRRVTRIADKNLPFGGTWTYVITATPEGSMLSITEAGEVYNPIFRFMSRFVFGHTRTMESYLTSLGDKFGEKITPEGD